MTAVDVVIVSYNTRELTRQCVTSLTRSPPAGLGRIILVDNASTDGTAASIREACPSATVIDSPRNAGFAAANNVGLRQATAPLVLFLNSDTIVPPGAIEGLVSRVEATGAVAAGPQLTSPAGDIEISWGWMLTPATELRQALRVRAGRSAVAVLRRWATRLMRRERWVDWVSGACLLVNRQAALAAGLFDERFFMYEEDIDFCAALRAAGGRILFTPAVRITHFGGGSAPRATLREYYDRSHLAFYAKHAPHWAAWLRLWQRLRGRSIR
jgi:hypothetical protein